ncbi:MAG: hypothetical protein ACI4PH_01170 [Faecousia sp.]
MAKKMIINCGDCDARNVSEETLAAYESIVINCGSVLVTPETRNLLNRYAVTMNCGDVLELGKDVRLKSINGSAQIRSTDAVPGKTYLQVNGTLEIGPDTQTVLEQYVGIQVNGSVTCPESVSGCLGMLKVNGSTVCYPDDAIVLKRNAVIDKVFALRAKNRRYWSAKRMIMVDPELDASALAAKGAEFSAKEVILSQSKVESLIGLIDETADIVIVPDGTRVIPDDVELDELTVKKYGTKLYVLGDLKVTKEARETLERLEYLNVQGDADVPGALKDLLLEKAEISGDVKILKGRYLTDKISARISKWMLEQEPEGVSVVDCVELRLDEEISNELILERLSVRDCTSVICTPEQESALAAVCEDVVNIGQASGDDEDMGVGDLIKGALHGAKELLDTKVINAGDYVL